MHHLAHSMTKLCQGREQDNAGWEGVPVYNSSGGKAVFVVVCRGGDLLYSRGWMNLDSLRLGIKTQMLELQRVHMYGPGWGIMISE